MSCWYGGNGSGVLKESPEVRRLLEAFEGLAGKCEEPVIISEGPEEGTISVEFDWYGHMSYSGASEIDEALQRLSVHVFGCRALAFEYHYEDEVNSMYVGSPEQQEYSRSESALCKIGELKEHLRPVDIGKAIEVLSG